MVNNLHTHTHTDDASWVIQGSPTQTGGAGNWLTSLLINGFDLLFLFYMDLKKRQEKVRRSCHMFSFSLQKIDSWSPKWNFWALLFSGDKWLSLDNAHQLRALLTEDNAGNYFLPKSQNEIIWLVEDLCPLRLVCVLLLSLSPSCLTWNEVGDCSSFHMFFNFHSRPSEIRPVWAAVQCADNKEFLHRRGKSNVCCGNLKGRYQRSINCKQQNQFNSVFYLRTCPFFSLSLKLTKADSIVDLAQTPNEWYEQIKCP